MIKRCISCVKFLTCVDKLKGTPGYSCIKFSKMQEFPTNALLLPKGESSYESVKASDGEPDVLVIEDLDDNFVADAMRRAYDPETNTIRDVRIDDSDLKLAKNFYDFCFNIVGSSVKPPFARQMWLAFHVLAEFCPKCTKPFWYEDIHNIPVDMETRSLCKKVAFLEHGVCPYCESTRGELMELGLLVDKTELVMIAGQRSGKSTLICMLIAYITHVFLKSPKLSGLCSGIQDFTPLAGTLTALTAGQAIKTLWNPFKKIITASSWYGSVFSLLDSYNEKYGKELYQFNPATGLYLRFFHKNLDLYSSGPAKRTLRGDCLVGSTIVNTEKGFLRFDELSFPEGAIEKEGMVATPFGPRSYSHTYRRTGRTTVRLNTRNKFNLEGTPEHPVLVLTPELLLEWVPLSEITVGTWLVSKSEKDKPIFGDNKSITKEMACILGTFTANGYQSTVSSNDQEVVKSFYSAVYKTIGTHPKIHGNASDKDTRARSHFVAGGGYGSGYSFVDVLRSWGYESVPSADKQIPLSVRTAPKEILHEYLEAYFACDSGINGGPTSKSRAKGRSTSVEVELTSASLGLTRQLQVILLQAYNLVSRLAKKVELKRMGKGNKNPPKNYTTYTLTLSGYDSWKFLQTFKRAKIKKYADRIKYTPPGQSSDRRSVPYVKEALSELIEKSRHSGIINSRGHINSKFGKGRLNESVSNVVNRGTGCSSESMIYERDHTELIKIVGLLSPVLAKRTKRLVERKIHFEQVTSIKQLAEKKKVYDFTVPDGHAFTANGLASHNTRFLAVTDELGLFPINFVTDEDGDGDDRERANADEVHQTLSTSLATVQAGVIEMRGKGINHIPQAINFNISSPFSWLDKICKLYIENQDNPSVLCAKEPTWEISPLYTREHPIIVAAYRRNAKKAERDFGANPPKIGSDFYKKESVLKCFQLDPWYAINYVASAEDTMGKAVQIKKLMRYPPSVLALDAGSHNNAFAITLTYRDEGKINVPVLLEVVPTKGRAVNFPYLYTNVILPIMKACNVKILTADRWSSLQILQQAKDDVKDLKVAQYSVRMSDFENVINLVDNESIFFPKLEMESDRIEVVTNYKTDLLNYPASHLYLQCITVQELGGTVTKGASPAGLQYTDDLHRAMVLGVSACLSEKVSNYLNKFKFVEREHVPGAGLVVGSRMGNMSDMLSKGYGRRMF